MPRRSSTPRSVVPRLPLPSSAQAWPPDRAKYSHLLSRQVRRSAFGALALLVLLVWSFWTTPAAHAHATYTRSDPPSGGQLATPGRIRATFSEDVDPAFSELQVF